MRGAALVPVVLGLSIGCVDDGPGAIAMYMGPSGPYEICNNDEDDNGDGLVDCDDPTCVYSSWCHKDPEREICDNGEDDNGDGLIDCDDPQCEDSSDCGTSEYGPPGGELHQRQGRQR